jgi:hypothetical protein
MAARKTSETSFFIRSTKDVGNTNTYHEKSIDLGAYVQASTGTILRIHSVSVAFTDNDGGSTTLAGNEAGVISWLLLTQSQTGLVLPSDKSVVASGQLNAFNDQGTIKVPSWVGESKDINPSNYRNGYLIATESLYLGGSATTTWTGDQYVSITLECTLEKMNAERAMALSLSQQ